MQPHHHRRLSHVLCEARAFGQSSTTALSVATNALKRVMLPIICVMGSQLTSKEIQLFLHDAVRTFTMAFVFKLSFKCICGLQPAALVSMMQRISATMPHLETLRITNVPDLGDRATEVVAALLPSSSLRVLQLKSSYPPQTWAGDQVMVLAKLPLLEELECDVSSSDGLDALLPLTLPTPGDEPFFPRLRSLTILVRGGVLSELKLCQRVLQSPLVQQLRSLECYLNTASRNSTPDTISLEPLAHIERLSKFLECCDFSDSPSFTLLQECRDLGDRFLYGSHLPGAVDLSGMECLESIGVKAFNGTQAASLILSPTLRFIGAEFCCNSSITELDLSYPPLWSLQFVSTKKFLRECESLKKFDTTPLLGAVGSHVGNSFMEGCRSMTELDLAGLRGVTSLGDSFLRDCTSLRTVRGCAALRSVESIGGGFLNGTRSLEEFDLSQLVSLRECGVWPLHGSALEETGKKILFQEIMDKNNNKKQAAGE